MITTNKTSKAIKKPLNGKGLSRPSYIQPELRYCSPRNARTKPDWTHRRRLVAEILTFDFQYWFRDTRKLEQWPSHHYDGQPRVIGYQTIGFNRCTGAGIAFRRNNRSAAY